MCTLGGQVIGVTKLLSDFRTSRRIHDNIVNVFRLCAPLRVRPANRLCDRMPGISVEILLHRDW
jgi:hypothetical protein